jgi:hypothetical protein
LTKKNWGITHYGNAYVMYIKDDELDRVQFMFTMQQRNDDKYMAATKNTYDKVHNQTPLYRACFWKAHKFQGT